MLELNQWQPGDSLEIRKQKFNANVMRLHRKFQQLKSQVEIGEIHGPQGAQGAQGAQGSSAGAQGTTGAQGVQGFAGITGAQGVQGLQGVQGATGAPGAQGNTGIQGDAGDPGPQGSQGSAGSNGATGSKGIVGANGAPGAQGAIGTTGSQGAAGNSGAGFKATSSSSVAIGLGTKNFTVVSGLAFTPGTRVRISSNANPTTHFFLGQVASYGGGVLSVTVDWTVGNGSYSDWQVSLDADQRGPQAGPRSPSPI
jgi:hypothetical protein